MKIAVLAWGSLVWDPRDLAAGSFASNGPLLPIEFCRVAGDGRLTLVIDEEFGAICKVYAAGSHFQALDRAIENLRLREGMTDSRGVGFVETGAGRRSDFAMKRHPDAVETISAWTQSSGYDAAIWTALISNFAEFGAGGEPFSVTAAIAYLEGLEKRDAARFAVALDYIRRAPAEVETPVREAVAKHWPG